MKIGNATKSGMKSAATTKTPKSNPALKQAPRLVNQMAKRGQKSGAVTQPDDRVQPNAPDANQGQMFDEGSLQAPSAKTETTPTDNPQVHGGHDGGGAGGLTDRNSLMTYFDHLRSKVNRQLDHVYHGASKLADSMGIEMQPPGEFGLQGGGAQQSHSQPNVGAAGPAGAGANVSHSSMGAGLPGMGAGAGAGSHVLPGMGAGGLKAALHKKFGPDFLKTLGLESTNG